ncbi:MAG: UDP-N-acetylmuramoyl-L-alanine--D-glutamate ligase [Vicinamibacterales bacterium]
MTTEKDVFTVQGLRVTVVGAARSGIAAAELLAKRGAAVMLSDAKPTLAEADRDRLIRAGVVLELGGHVAATFDRADLIVMSPGVPPTLPALARARAAGVPVIGEVELAFRWLTGRVIAITGTKGKSTTTSLTGRMLRDAGLAVTVGGNIGAPVSAQVEQSTPDTLHVIEVSSFQLEQIDSFRPWVAVMLNFSPDHLDRHHTVEAYAAAKARIFENQRPDDFAVMNADDDGAMQLASSAVATRRLFSRRGMVADGTVVEDGWIVARDGERRDRLVPVSSIRLLGEHLIDDVMAAATVASIAGVSPAAMTTAVEGFGGLEHAMELVADFDGVRFVNDSKATNVEAAVRCDRELSRRGRGHRRGEVQGGRFPSVAIADWRAWQSSRRDRRGQGARSTGARGRDCGARRRFDGRRRSNRVRARETVRSGAAGTGVCELRHVPRLRGARTALQGRGQR